MSLIDLGFEFFLIKFQKEENLQTTLHGGPWFVLNHFLFVRQWEPKFIASNTQLTYSAIWVRLPELPTEFYDMEILQRVGAKLDLMIPRKTIKPIQTPNQFDPILEDMDTSSTQNDKAIFQPASIHELTATLCYLECQSVGPNGPHNKDTPAIIDTTHSSFVIKPTKTNIHSNNNSHTFINNPQTRQVGNQLINIATQTEQSGKDTSFTHHNTEPNLSLHSLANHDNMHATLGYKVTASQTPILSHDYIPCAKPYQDTTSPSPSLHTTGTFTHPNTTSGEANSSSKASSLQTCNTQAPIFSFPPKNHAASELHQHQLQQLFQTTNPPKQPILPSTSSDHARPLVSKPIDAINLHTPTSHGEPSSTVLAGDGTPGLCSDFHFRTQQSGGNPPSPKSDTFGRNCDGGDEIWDGGLRSNVVVHNSNSIDSGPPSINIPTATVGISHAPTDPICQPPDESTPFYPPHHWGQIYAP
uniref:Uncharacterized protein LOC104234294 n=1 Tax=Nicotiana sylvestris TaxID=4096 RepID=A0A1U7X900_NICSY|nr:PREDICTED: uncharacterized protein LOC104234294 [Nicotiana sylvestris]